MCMPMGLGNLKKRIERIVRVVAPAHMDRPESQKED